MTRRPPLAAFPVVSFDACDTVIVSEPPVPVVIHGVCRDLGYEVSRETVEAIYRRAMDALTEAAVRAHLDAAPRPAGRNFDVWRRAFCGDPRWPGLGPEDFGRLERRLGDFRFDLVPAPGAERALEALRAAGRRLCVTSNFDETLGDVLERAGLSHFFEAVIASEAVGFEKPDPRIFRATLEAMQVPPGDMVHVGDHAFDVMGARAAGVACVWLRAPGTPVPEGMPPPDAEVERLADLPALLGVPSAPL